MHLTTLETGRLRGGQWKGQDKRVGDDEGGKQGRKTLESIQVSESQVRRIQQCTRQRGSLPSWCGSQDHCGDAAAPGRGRGRSPTFHTRRLQSLKSLLRRRASVTAGDHLAQRGPPPGTPGPGRSPWCSPNPLMSSVKTPGSLSMRHHSPALLDMAPTTHRPAPPRALRNPQHKLPPAADLSKTRRGASTPRHPAYFPTASGRRHLPRDGAQKDALATQETSKRLFSLSGSVAPSAEPEKGRERRREAHPGPLAPRSWGGAMEGAGLGMGRGSLRPEPGAVLALSGRRLFPVLRRASVGAAGPEHRLPGTGGSLQAYCGAGNRVLCSPSDPGHSRSGRCALFHRHPSVRGQRKPSPPLCFCAHWRTGPILHPYISNLAQLLRRVESWGTQVNSAAYKAPGERECQGPFSLFLSFLLRLCHRGVVSDAGLGRSFVGRPKAKLS